MRNETSQAPDTCADLANLIRLSIPKGESFALLRPAWAEGTAAAARPAKGRQRDEDEDEDDEDEDEDEDEKPRKKVKAKAVESKPGKKAKEDEKPRKKAKAKEQEEEEDEDDEPRERRVPKQGTRRYSLYVVNNGLATLHGVLIALFVISFISSLDTTLFQVLGVGVTGPAANKQRDSMGYASAIFVMILQGAMPLAFLVVEGMCFFTPAKADAKGSLIAAFVLHIASPLLLLIGLLSPYMFGLEPLVTNRLQFFLMAAAHAAFWLGFVMVITYLKAAYYYLNDQPSGNNVSTLGLFYVIIIVLGYGLFFAMQFLGGWLDWLYFILAPGWFLWDGAILRVHILLLRQLRRLRKRIDRIVYPDEDEEEEAKKD